MVGNKITIVGAGTTGYSLALAYSWGGYQVTLLDKDANQLEKAISLIKSAINVLKSEGLIKEKESENILCRIETTIDDVEAYSEADFMLEAVYEDEQIKKEVFKQADKYCPEHTIFMSNTSYLNIFRFVEVKRSRRKRLLITHWYAPPHIIPLVEVVTSDDTSSDVLNTVIDSLEAIGKTPVCLKYYIPGFIVNRIQYLISSEMFWLVDNGYAEVEDIDKAVKASIGIRMPVVGIMQSLDFTGFDTLLRTRSTTKIEPEWSPGPPKLIKDKVDKGELGVKTGKGIYSYTSKPEDVLQTRDLNYIRILRQLKELKPLE